MGYTHYYYRTPQPKPCTDEQWKSLTSFAAALFENQKGILANGRGDIGTSPEITDDEIIFNGIGDDSHETLYFHRNPEESVPDYRKRETGDDRYFDFCKTARKPYDTAVVAFLKRAERLGLIKFSSDGEGDELAAGIALEQSIS